MLACLLMTAVGFLSGSVMYSYLIPRLLRGVDVREVGDDRNPGSTNAIRAAGKPIGFVCMALDVFKAFVPVFTAVSLIHIEGFFLVPVVAAPIAGHAFSPFMGFRGGKGVACLFGSLLGMWCVSKLVLVLIITLATFQFLIVVRPDALRVVAGVVVSCLVIFLFEIDTAPFRLAFLLSGMIVLFRHASVAFREDKSVLVGHYEVEYKDRKLTMRKVG